MENNKGCFYSVGLGPGDPELITYKAAKTVQKADVIFLPVAKKSQCHAYKIIEKADLEIEGKIIIGIDFPMTKDENALKETYKKAADLIEQYLKKGLNVIFPVIGDSTIYATCAYVHDVLKERGNKTEFISGIPSFVAAAATLNIPLSTKAEEIHIIPASYGVKDAFKLHGTLIFMKSGKAIKMLLDELEKIKNERNIDVYAAANIGMENEKLMHGIDEIRKNNDYLITIIVKGA